MKQDNVSEVVRRVSIIVPCYNSEETLQPCLDSISVLEKSCEIEVILIDDGSTDRTFLIAKQYPFQVIKLDSNSGAAHARNVGAAAATGDILFFVDSDVILPRNGVQLILETIGVTADCVVGIFSSHNPFHDGFFSHYKSYYCNYKYMNLNGSSAFNTAVAAVPTWIFRELGGFMENLKASEDSEFGDRLFKSGWKIYIDRRLEVIHLKRFSMGSLLVNDFKKSASLAELFLTQLRNGTLARKMEFTDISVRMMLNIPVTFFFIVLGILSVCMSSELFFLLHLFLGLLILFNNGPFFSYLRKSQKSKRFIIGTFLFMILDYVVVAIAVAKGFVASIGTSGELVTRKLVNK